MGDTKRYLGDGVYADFDGEAVILTTENGVSVTNTIELDQHTLKSFDIYRQTLDEKLRTGNEDSNAN